MRKDYPFKGFLTWIGCLCLVLFAEQAQAQPCNFPFSPSNTCANAPLVCDLDGLCSRNDAATNSGTPNAFCGQVENNNWIAFIAGSTSFQIQIDVSNCNQGSGLQAQFFSTNNCVNFSAVSNCLDPVNGSGTLICENLVIGMPVWTTLKFCVEDAKETRVIKLLINIITRIAIKNAREKTSQSIISSS